jgi:hypothetical protein
VSEKESMRKISMERLTGGLFALVLLAGIASAEPDITAAVSNMDGTVTITGDGFGENLLNFSWLGGMDGYIESGTLGQPADNWPSGWSRLDNAWPDPVFDGEAHSGSKSLLQHDAPGDEFWAAEPIMYRLPSSQKTVYVSFWAKLDILQGSFGQWKVLRISPDNDVSDAQSGEWDFLFNRVSGSTYRGMQCEVSSGDWTDGYPGDDYNLRYLNSYGGVSIQSGKWQRFDIELTHNSEPGAEDGRLVVRSQQGTDNPKESTMNDGWETRCDADDVLTRYVIWQGYGGNGIEAEKIWTDDMYVQWGTIARVELCIGSSWQDRGSCEIQPAESWTGDSVRINLNKGALNQETAYLYIVDSAGITNEPGFPIALSPANDQSDRCISMTELAASIDRWFRDEIALGDIMAEIRIWKEGCP